jgi:hypothetical protein
MIQSVTTHLLTPGCVASRNLGEPQRALFHFFAGLETLREEIKPDHDCPLLLIQYGRESTAPAISGWRVMWDGHRRGDATELFVLYRRTSS